MTSSHWQKYQQMSAQAHPPPSGYSVPRLSQQGDKMPFPTIQSMAAAGQNKYSITTTEQHPDAALKYYTEAKYCSGFRTTLGYCRATVIH